MNLRTAAGYAVGDFGINLYFISVMTYLLYFYTDVLGISAVAAGSVFAVARFIDAVTDPVMGAIAERTRSRWGRMRPYILFGAVPLGVISVLTFTVPDFDTTGKIVWKYRSIESTDENVRIAFFIFAGNIADQHPDRLAHLNGGKAYTRSGIHRLKHTIHLLLDIG